MDLEIWTGRDTDGSPEGQWRSVGAEGGAQFLIKRRLSRKL